MDIAVCKTALTPLGLGNMGTQIFLQHKTNLLWLWEQTKNHMTSLLLKYGLGLKESFVVQKLNWDI